MKGVLKRGTFSTQEKEKREEAEKKKGILGERIGKLDGEEKAGYSEKKGRRGGK